MIPLPNKPKVVEKQGYRAVVRVDALYPGYGATIGNSLRRVLFSSLEGSAITHVQIKGVQHEFTAVPGVMEDVLTIILNLKNLHFKLFDDEPQRFTLKVKGEKKVTGKDFEIPTQVELMNPDQHIATLTDKKSELEMEVTVEKGLGYATADQNKKAKLEVGQIAIDSIFSPVRHVNFRVDNMRVGKRTDYDSLIMEIETDGTIEPEEAFRQSVSVIIGQLSNLLDQEENVVSFEEEKVEEKTVDTASLTLEELGLSTRLVNILAKGGVKSLKGILAKKEETILNIEGMGEKGVEEIKEALSQHGLELKQ